MDNLLFRSLPRITSNQSTSCSQQGVLQNVDVFTEISADQDETHVPNCLFMFVKCFVCNRQRQLLFGINIHGYYPNCKKILTVM